MAMLKKEKEISIYPFALEKTKNLKYPNFMSFGDITLSLEIQKNKDQKRINFNFEVTSPPEKLPLELEIKAISTPFNLISQKATFSTDFPNKKIPASLEKCCKDKYDEEMILNINFIISVLGNRTDLILKEKVETVLCEISDDKPVDEEFDVKNLRKGFAVFSKKAESVPSKSTHNFDLKPPKTESGSESSDDTKSEKPNRGPAESECALPRKKVSVPKSMRAIAAKKAKETKCAPKAERESTSSSEDSDKPSPTSERSKSPKESAASSQPKSTHNFDPKPPKTERSSESSDDTKSEKPHRGSDESEDVIPHKKVTVPKSMRVISAKRSNVASGVRNRSKETKAERESTSSSDDSDKPSPTSVKSKSSKESAVSSRPKSANASLDTKKDEVRLLKINIPKIKKKAGCAKPVDRNRSDRISGAKIFDDSDDELKTKISKPPQRASQKVDSPKSYQKKVESDDDDSDEGIKYHGLYNQGATCYINSSIQTLFHIPYFRNFVFQLRYNPGTVESELQSLFFNLENENSSTKEFTKSLGMSEENVLEHKDIQEFIVRLISDLQESVNDDDELKGQIPYIFEGQTKFVIKRKNGKVLNTLQESFNQLLISISPTISESLKIQFGSDTIDDYIVDEKEETVETQTKLVTLPRVLQIILKRYKINEMTDSMVKDSSRMQFDEKINLAPFIENDSDKKVCSQYSLYGVVVHRGSLKNGHYYVYLNINMLDEWYCFNDSNVTKVLKNEAIDNNFGKKQSYSSTAYVLVYIRDDVINEMFMKNDKNVYQEINIPDLLVTSIKTKIISKDSYEIYFKIFNEIGVISNCNNGLTSFINENNAFQIKANLKSDASELYKNVSEKLNIDSDDFYLWTISKDRTHFLKILDSSDELNDIDNPELFIDFNGEFYGDDIEIEDMRTYFIFLYTRNPLYPFVYLKPFHTNPFLNYSEIIGDSINFIKEKLNLHEISEEKSDLFLIKSNQAEFKKPPAMCADKSGSIMVIQINNDFEIDVSKIKELEKKQMFALKSLKNHPKKKEEETFNYSNYEGKKLPVKLKDFLEIRNCAQDVDVFSFENINEKVGTIEVPNDIRYADLVKFIKKMFESRCDFDHKNEVVLLFEKEEKREIPKKKPIEKDFRFNGSIGTIYYCAVSKEYASDPSSETRVIQFSNDGYSVSKAACFYLPESEIHPFFKFQFYFFDDENVRMFIINQKNEVTPPIENDHDFSFNNENILRIEKVRPEEIGKEMICLQQAVVDKYKKICKYGNPFYFLYVKNERVSDFHKRVEKILGKRISNFEIHRKRPLFNNSDVVKERFNKNKDEKYFYLIFKKESDIFISQ